MQIPIFTRHADAEAVVGQQCYWQGVPGNPRPVQVCYESLQTPLHVTTAQDHLQQFANAYWIYGLILLLWMGFCLILRTTGITDLTVNHYETYEGYDLHHAAQVLKEHLDEEEDDDE